MAAADSSFIVGIVGNVISLLVFASPIATFWRIVKRKSIESFKGVPYTTTLLSTTLWTFYGLLKPGGLLVVTVNGAGSLLQIIYVTLYLIYAPKDTRICMAKLVAVLDIGVLGVVIMVTLLAIHGRSLRLLVVGCLCAALTVGMYAAPMAAMRRVVKTKSVEFMPFWLSFFLFLNGGAWSVYAALIRDYFIGIPNAIGFVLGSVQLILYAIYSRKTPPRDGEEEEKEKEVGLASHVEMQRLWEKERSAGEQRHLSKGSSLSKLSSLTHQHSLKKIVKSLSLTPYELHAKWQDDGRTEV